MELPLAPRFPENFSPQAIHPTWVFHLMRSVNRTARHGDAPLRRTYDIIDCGVRCNEEEPFPQALEALFKQLLRKKHAILAAMSGLPGTVPGNRTLSNILFQFQFVTTKQLRS
jgi:hypothetical protein